MLSQPRSFRRTESQWRAAIERNRAVAKVSDLKGAIQIYKGRYFWPLQPSHPGNDYDIETIAHTLAVMPRWGGQTAWPDGTPLRYSVAQHSVHVAEVCQRAYREIVPGWDWDNSPSPALLALLHDSPEGYGFADLVRPVKLNVEGYKAAEERLMNEVIYQFKIPTNAGIVECVRRIDNMMVFLERDKMMGEPVVPYSNEMDHPRTSIEEVIPNFEIWSAEYAKERFLQTYEAIMNGTFNGE